MRDKNANNPLFLGFFLCYVLNDLIRFDIVYQIELCRENKMSCLE